MELSNNIHSKLQSAMKKIFLLKGLDCPNCSAKIEKEEATAFLTGIVAATNRFSNAKTTSSTMKLASRLMESGANQQLIAKNITADTENEIFSVLGDTSENGKTPTSTPSEDQPAEEQPKKVEEKDKELYKGHTKNYIQVVVKGENLENQIDLI